MQAITIVLSTLYLCILVIPVTSSANSCIHSVDRQEDTVLLRTRLVSRLVSPAKSGSMFYSQYCGESRHIDGTRSSGLVRVNDCYEGIYPSMCDYNPNRIPSKIQMKDCGKCGSNDNRSRRLARCIKYINGKAVRGHWQPMAMNISLPFKTSTSKTYQLMTQKISYACYCHTTRK